MTSKTAVRRDKDRREALEAVRTAQSRRVRRRNTLITAVAVLAVGALIAGMMLSSRTTSSAATRVAPDFTLTDTSGKQVHLAAFRGRSTVVLYFNEGAGCGSCFQQMAAIEQDKPAFDKAGITVLPIVMNTREQLAPELQTYRITTPYLLDHDGAVSKAYDTLGKGMHAGLPGHGFVLIDKNGTQRWYGEYPSMWLSPEDLLGQVNKHLAA